MPAGAGGSAEGSGHCEVGTEPRGTAAAGAEPDGAL